jgi:hypothetical protein
MGSITATRYILASGRQVREEEVEVGPKVLFIV